MALWKGLITIKDRKNRLRNVQIRVNDDATEGDELTPFMQEVALVIDLMITGQVVDISVVRTIPLPAGMKAAPMLNSDVEEGALWIWKTDNGFTVKQRIPTFDETYFVAGTRYVDQSEENPLFFINLTVNASELPDEYSLWTIDSRNRRLVDLKSAEEDFKP